MECFAEQTQRNETTRKMMEQLKQDYDNQMNKRVSEGSEDSVRELGNKLADQFNEQLNILHRMVETTDSNHRDGLNTLVQELSQKLRHQDS